MPSSPADLQKAAYLRALVLGEPLVGKTQNCVATAEGPILIIACDGESNLQPAARVRDDFFYELVTGDKSASLIAKMSAAVSMAIQGAREGKWKTIILDTITSYAEALEMAQEVEKNGAEDHGRTARKYHHTVASTIERLKMAPAHLIVLAHYIELEGGIMPGQEKRKGRGIVPLLMGASRKTFAKRFDAVVMLEKKSSGERVFTGGGTSFYGTGWRAPGSLDEIPADVGELWNLVRGGEKAAKKTTPAKPVLKTATAIKK
jgi:hypothetical protein